MTYRLTYTDGTPIVEERVKKKFFGISYEVWQATSSRPLKDAAQAFNANLSPKKFNTDKHTEFAFTLDGIDYYKFTSDLSMPPMRYAVSLTFLKEASMNCDRLHLLAFIKALKENINSTTIRITEIAAMIHDLEQRLEFAYTPDLIYKLASVMYFDGSEDPENYDWKYNREKVKKWKGAGADFFLQTLAKGLIASDLIYKENSQTYMMILNMSDQQSTKDLLQKLPKDLNSEQLKSFSELLTRVEQT